MEVKLLKLLIYESYLFQRWREIELGEVFHLLAFRKVRENVDTVAGGNACPDAQLRERLLRIVPDGFTRYRHLPEHTVLRDILAQ